MRRHLRFFLLISLTGLCGCATQTPVTAPPASPPPPVAIAPQPFFTETGLASFYGPGENGKLRADGGRFDAGAFTAAHRTLPFGTVVRVTDLESGRMVKVEINDRGPHIKGRIIDLSAAAAAALGMHKSGLAQVRLEAFRSDQGSAAERQVSDLDPSGAPAPGP